MFSIGSIIAWFTGGGFKSIASELRQARADVLAAENNEQRIAAEERMNLALHRVGAQTQGAGNWAAKAMRALFALPVAVYNAKLFLWDKAFGWGTTDSLSPYLENVAWTVIAFYFLDNTIRLARNR